MAGLIDNFADELYATIEAERVATNYAVNDFDVEVGYYPDLTLESIKTAAKVWVVPMNYDQTRLARDEKTDTLTIPLQIGVQKGVNVQDKTTIRLYNQLVDELRSTCREFVGSNNSLAWFTNEALKDGEGLPFYFMGLRAGAFESYFTAKYSYFRKET